MWSKFCDMHVISLFCAVVLFLCAGSLNGNLCGIFVLFGPCVRMVVASQETFIL